MAIFDRIPKPPRNGSYRDEYEGCAYMTMVQLYNIAHSHGMIRNKACS